MQSKTKNNHIFSNIFIIFYKSSTMAFSCRFLLSESLARTFRVLAFLNCTRAITIVFPYSFCEFSVSVIIRISSCYHFPPPLRSSFITSKQGYQKQADGLKSYGQLSALLHLSLLTQRIGGGIFGLRFPICRQPPINRCNNRIT